MNKLRSIVDSVKHNKVYWLREALAGTASFLTGLGASSGLYKLSQEFEQLDISEGWNAILTYTAKTAVYLPAKAAFSKNHIKEQYKSNRRSCAIMMLGAGLHYGMMKSGYPAPVSYLVGYPLAFCVAWSYKLRRDFKVGILRKPEGLEALVESSTNSPKPKQSL